MSERKLVTLRFVNEIKQIPEADNLEVARINDLHCIVPKNVFKENDLAVFFEVDSLLPIEDRYEFLRKSCYMKMGPLEGFLINKKVFAQGLLLPMNIFPELNGSAKFLDYDYSGKLNVMLYVEGDRLE